MKKRVFSIGAAALMLIFSASCLPVSETAVYAEETQMTYENLTYRIANESYIEITGCDKAAKEVVIPAEIDGLPVKCIAWRAFQQCYALRSVEIPYGVEYLDAGAFLYCMNLSSVTLPDSVRYIADDVFGYCRSLSSVTIPEGVTYIGDDAFENCTSLSSVTIPEGVTHIGDEAFENCTSLRSVSILEGVTRINDYLFFNCKNLTAVSLPSGVSRIGAYAFSGCEALSSVNIPSSVKRIGASAFSGCKSLRSVTVANEMTSIGKFAFSNSGLREFSFPYYVKTIEQSVFANCAELRSVWIPDDVESIGKEAFYGCSSLNTISIPFSVKSIGDYAFAQCSNLKSVTVPESVTSIGENAFLASPLTICAEPGSYAEQYAVKAKIPYGTEKISGDFRYWVLDNQYIEITGMLNYEDAWEREIVIPAEIDGLPVKRIGDYAFCGYCLESVIIPDSVTSIGEGAFQCNEDFMICGSVGSYAEKYAAANNIPFALGGTIGALTFRSVNGAYIEIMGCDKEAAEVMIPEEIGGLPVTHIGDNAFYGCRMLREVNLPATLTGIGENAFSICSALASIAIPEGVQSIGTDAFMCCGSLSSVTIPKSVQSIGACAFAFCRKLTEISVHPENPEYISADGVLFSRDMTALLQYPAGKPDTAYAVPDGVRIIDKCAFIGCSALTDIAVPYGITGIAGGTFACCSSLRSFTVPESVTYIGRMAFAYCEQLSTVTIPDSVAMIGYYAFGEELQHFLEEELHSIIGEIPRSSDHLTICGVSGSCAEEYAERYGTPFVSVGAAIAGDLNGDGAVNLKDAVILRRYIAGGWDILLYEKKADLNSDGTINLKDVVILRRYIAGGWDITL